MLVFENRGAAVGATIDHPHGQIYAFGEVPPVPVAEAERAGADDPLAAPADPATVVATAIGWLARAPASATHPLEVVLAPDQPLADLPAAPAAARDGLAVLLVDVLQRCDRLYDEPLPYMLWIHQRPPLLAAWPVRLHLHLVSPMRLPPTRGGTLPPASWARACSSTPSTRWRRPSASVPRSSPSRSQEASSCP